MLRHADPPRDGLITLSTERLPQKGSFFCAHTTDFWGVKNYRRRIVAFVA
jgi:hypothetical protein